MENVDELIEFDRTKRVAEDMIPVRDVVELPRVHPNGRIRGID
jgi:hypothetical protein